MNTSSLLPECATAIIAVCAAGILAAQLNIDLLAKISFTILIAAISLLMIRTHMCIRMMQKQLLIKERMMKFALDDFAKKMSKRQEESLRQISDTFEDRSKRMYR